MDGAQERRKMPALLDLGAQAMDVNVNRALVAVKIESPDALQEPVARQRDARVSGKLHQQRELARLEPSVGAVDTRLTCALIDLQAAEAQHRTCLREGPAAPAQDRLHPHHQL